ncbi:unnamed protein product [Meloidogyne enterolobii]|uniref:Uncharacterized protein n=1 Tax=Meloidogyne enterolobii TaxID=390850 RepID=A0ACB1A8E4_MELEN
MSYCSIRPNDNGLLQYGTNSYGGFAYRLGSFEDETIVYDPTKRFITEHNLSLFWRRPGLYPRPGGFMPLPISWPSNQNGLRNRPPGQIRADCPPLRHRGRNLLAGQNVEDDEEGIRIWSINDNSDHKQLVQFNLKIEQQSRQRRKPLLVKPNEEFPFISMDLPNEVLQLLAFEGGEGKVFARTKRSLELASPFEKSLSTLFKSFVHSFTQIPYMNDEIAVVDSRGILYWGNINNNNSTSFARLKNPEPILEICPTDCPRILMSLTEQQLKEVDLREPISCTGRLLFDHSIFSQLETKGPFSRNLTEHLNARNRLWHINQIDTKLECFLLTTTRQHILIDRRMPNISLLTMDHADIEGGDYCFTTPQFVDPITDSRIYSFYSLIHIKKPALSQCSFAFHPNECLWSSLCSKSNLDSPKEVFARSIDNESFDFDVSQLPSITRAVHFQPLISNLSISSRRALFFRQMEGGKILYENVFFDPLPKLKQDEEFDILCEENGNYDGSFTQKPISISSINKNCFEFISNIQDENKFFNDVDEQLIAGNEIELLDASTLITNDEQQHLNLSEYFPLEEFDEPLSGYQIFDEPEVTVQCDFAFMETSSTDEKNMFSSHIDKIWTKTFTSSKNQQNQPIFDKNDEDTKIINLNGSMENEVENFTATKLEELKLEVRARKRIRKEIEEEKEMTRKKIVKEVPEGEEEEREEQPTMPKWMMETSMKSQNEEQEGDVDEYDFEVNLE